MNHKSIFITVGTTKFDDLINIVLQFDVLQVLKSKGCEKLTLQVGNSKVPPFNDGDRIGISIELFNYKPDINNEMKNADLIISHAGAGTVLEALDLRKKVIVVVNQKLMDNHQVELADKLKSEGYLLSCTPVELVSVIKNADFQSLKLFPNDYSRKCVNIIEKLFKNCRRCSE